jgi:hypothetical protein
VSGRGGGPARLAYVRLGLDRPLPLPPGRHVIAAGPSDKGQHRLTGIERDEADTDVLDLRASVPAGAPAAKRRRGRPPVTADALFVSTLVRASEPQTMAQADAVLEGWRRDSGEVRQWLGAGLATLNRALRAHRLVQRDPYAVEVTTEDVAWATVGHATAETLAEGGAGEEIDALDRRRLRRQNAVQRAKPGAVVSASLTGELALLEGEELVSVAVREANHDRLRSAAAALAAGNRLLAEELGLDLPTGRVAPDRTAILDACRDLQDTVDGWRIGEFQENASSAGAREEAWVDREDRVAGHGRPTGPSPGAEPRRT